MTAKTTLLTYRTHNPSSSEDSCDVDQSYAHQVSGTFENNEHPVGGYRRATAGEIAEKLSPPHELR
jgi:hypothetical protein